MVQEYGRYFDMRTACFRGGTLTGPAHSATELHGFLAYVMRCNMERRTYKIFGYKGKMVRDAIHSHDVVNAFEAFFRNPRSAAVYNLGGGRHSNCSHLEAFALAEQIIRAGDDHRVPWRRTGSATTSGGSAPMRRSRPTTRTGSRSTTCR